MASCSLSQVSCFFSLSLLVYASASPPVLFSTPGEGALLLGTPLCTVLPPQEEDIVHAPLWTHYLHPLGNVGISPNPTEASTKKSSGKFHTAFRIHESLKLRYYLEEFKKSNSLQAPFRPLEQEFNAIAISPSIQDVLGIIHLKSSQATA